MTRLPDEDFIKKQSGEIKKEDIGKLLEREEEFEEALNKFKPGTFEKGVFRFKLLWMFLKDYWNGEYLKAPWATLTAATFAIIYVLNPIDLIPDAIPIVGFADDAAVLMAVWAIAKRDLKAYAEWKKLDLNYYF